MTIGAMVGATLSGRVADLLGRRRVCSAKPLYMTLSLYKDFRATSSLTHLFFSILVLIVRQAMGLSEISCVVGWLSIMFSKVFSVFLVALYDSIVPFVLHLTAEENADFPNKT
jgi:MFS family permease